MAYRKVHIFLSLAVHSSFCSALGLLWMGSSKYDTTWAFHIDSAQYLQAQLLRILLAVDFFSLVRGSQDATGSYVHEPEVDSSCILEVF